MGVEKTFYTIASTSLSSTKPYYIIAIRSTSAALPLLSSTPHPPRQAQRQPPPAPPVFNYLYNIANCRRRWWCTRGKIERRVHQYNACAHVCRPTMWTSVCWEKPSFLAFAPPPPSPAAPPRRRSLLLRVPSSPTSAS